MSQELVFITKSRYEHLLKEIKEEIQSNKKRYVEAERMKSERKEKNGRNENYGVERMRSIRNNNKSAYDVFHNTKRRRSEINYIKEQTGSGLNTKAIGNKTLYVKRKFSSVDQLIRKKNQKIRRDWIEYNV